MTTRDDEDTDAPANADSAHTVDFDCPWCKVRFEVESVFWEDKVPCPRCGHQSDVDALYLERMNRMERRKYLEDENFRVTNIRFSAADVAEDGMGCRFRAETFLIKDIESVELRKPRWTDFPRVYWLFIRVGRTTYRIGMPTIGRQYAERVARALQNAVAAGDNWEQCNR